MDDSTWYDKEMATFGDRLSAARAAAGLSRKELAQRLGVKVSTMRNWEDDASEPRANRISILAGLLGVSLSWLLTGEGEGVAPPTEDAPAPDTMADLLMDLRSLRLEMAQANARLALLEKRLRAVVTE